LPVVFWPILTTFVLLVLAGVGAPIPEEVPTLGAGIWVANSPELGPGRWVILLVCFAGVILSDLMLYGIGRLWGPRLMQRRWLARLFPAEKRQQVEENFSRYGVKVLLAIRWIPAIRSPMFVTAGIMRVPLLRFVVADGLAAILGHSLLFFLAYWLGEQFREMIVRAEHTVGTVLKSALIVGGILAVCLSLLVHFLRRPVSTADPKELPLIGPQVAAHIEYADRRDEKAPLAPKVVPERVPSEDRGARLEDRKA
jgi:membrane protein DedA with SNARE-associated domain